MRAFVDHEVLESALEVEVGHEGPLPGAHAHDLGRVLPEELESKRSEVEVRKLPCDAEPGLLAKDALDRRWRNERDRANEPLECARLRSRGSRPSTIAWSRGRT